MHRFITGLSKLPAKRKSKTDEEKRERHNVYDTTKRQRVYLQSGKGITHGCSMNVQKNCMFCRPKKGGLVKFLAD